ncbi:uncharacterized protein [Coffea arabica]|uniref:Exostosin GT47 domain-containing protein n=1 Tax=Coffea arabica TaxID=13443 RepID=A0ABM4VCH0_COFAR
MHISSKYAIYGFTALSLLFLFFLEMYVSTILLMGWKKHNHSGSVCSSEIRKGKAGANTMEGRKKAPSISILSNTTALDKDVVLGQQQSQFALIGGISSKKAVPATKKTTKSTERTVVKIRELNYMFQRHTSSPPNSTILPSSARDKQLLKPRLEMEKVETVNDKSGLYAPIYWNISRFERHHEASISWSKLYLLLLQPLPTLNFQVGIFAMITISDAIISILLYTEMFSSKQSCYWLQFPHMNAVVAYKARYSFLNRISGADHFLVACHDWAPEETKTLMANCIRALCNVDTKEGFQLGKDVPLPETYVHSSVSSTRGLGGKPPSQRQILAFFAGNMHGYVRPLLLQHWENKDPDMKIVGRLRKDSYIQQMKNSKFCICARGYEVNSPRLVEAIMYGCVPMIISDNYVPPFLEVLNWEKFAIFVLEKDIPNLKTILMSISHRRYLVMQHRVKQVRQHFLWHQLPVKQSPDNIYKLSRRHYYNNNPLLHLHPFLSLQADYAEVGKTTRNVYVPRNFTVLKGLPGVT